MEPPIAAALLGVLRAATAIEEELELLARAQPREAFPHAALIAALPAPGQLRTKTDQFCEEVIKYPAQHAITTFTATSKQLSSLHTAAQGLRSAVEWSSRFTAIDSWVARRLFELGLNKKVLVAPGRLGDFSIERTSRFREVLVELGEGGRLLSAEGGELDPIFVPYRDALSDFHLLRVPASDGISPAWHPLVLGHELAHLRYTDLAIRTWLAEFDPESELVTAAVAAAKAFANKTGVELMTRSPWMGQLERWLTELACDSVANCIYGMEGLEALETVLIAYAVPMASASHPSPQLRLAIQRADSVSDLDVFKPVGDPFASQETQVTSALLALALPLRDQVRLEMTEIFGAELALANEVADHTAKSLAAGAVPSSCDWPEGEVSARASIIESGLVRGHWRRFADLAQELPASEIEQRRNLDFVSQAIDALEFAARFDAQRLDLQTHAQERMPIPNVLWLSNNGVRTHRDAATGLPSYDLRLGRHFIVFQRSAVPNVDSLGGGTALSAIQRPTEVGWGDRFILHPSELVLAVTFETLVLDNTCSAQVLSRSSLGRLGLLSATAVQVQPGYQGTLTLELVNLANVPLRISPGQRIAQIVPLPILGDAEAYAGAYQNAGAKPAFSRSQEDWDAGILTRMRGKTL